MHGTWFSRDLRLTVGVVGWLWLAAVAGCGAAGPERAAIHGRITFNGEPVKQGIIVFLPKDSKAGPSSGGAIIDGAFSLAAMDGPVLGLHRVEVTAMKTDDKKKAAEGIGGATGSPSGAASTPPLVQIIPPKYNQQSELTFDVKPKDNTYDLDLKAMP